MAKTQNNTVEQNMARTSVSMRGEVRNLGYQFEQRGGDVAAKAVKLGVPHEQAVEYGVRAARRSWIREFVGNLFGGK